MDAGSEAVDLMVREGLQITEASIKLLAAGSKNLAAFLYALAKDNKRVSGRTNMGRLLREGKELRVFQLRESDLAAFHAYAKKGVLYAVVKDKNARDVKISRPWIHIHLFLPWVSTAFLPEYSGYAKRKSGLFRPLF